MSVYHTRPKNLIMFSFRRRRLMFSEIRLDKLRFPNICCRFWDLLLGCWAFRMFLAFVICVPIHFVHSTVISSYHCYKSWCICATSVNGIGQSKYYRLTQAQSSMALFLASHSPVYCRLNAVSSSELGPVTFLFPLMRCKWLLNILPALRIMQQICCIGGTEGS